MRRIVVISFIALLIVIMPNTILHSHINQWRIVNVKNIPAAVGFPFEVSSDGNYIYEFSGPQVIHDLKNLTRKLETLSYGDGTRWRGNTIAIHEFAYYGFPGSQCADADALAIKIYTTVSKTSTLSCLQPTKMYWFELNPFTSNSLFANNRYFIDLQDNSIQDLQGQLTTHVSLLDSVQWIGSGQSWWNPKSKLPMATLERKVSRIDDNTNVKQMLQLCPIQSDDCKEILSVEKYIHGDVDDFVVTPDGQTILWSAIEIPRARLIEGTFPGIGIAQDIVAFATDVQTGITSEIFRLSQYNPKLKVGTRTRWSGDATILAILITKTNLSEGNDSVVIAQVAN